MTAPTGIKAYNIRGLTLHRLLQLPVEHGGIANYKELSPAGFKQIRQTLKDVDLIIIDEISMVSNVMLMYIHLRLTEIFNIPTVKTATLARIISFFSATYSNFHLFMNLPYLKKWKQSK